MRAKLAIAIAAALMTSACASNSPATPMQDAAKPAAPQVQMAAPAAQAEATGEITLEQIMADQDWVARSPEGAYWSLDGESVFYAQKQLGTPLRDWFHAPVGEGELHQVPLAKMHHYAYEDAVQIAGTTWFAYTYEGNIFAREMASGEVQQLTRDDAQQTSLVALNDGRIGYREGNAFFALDMATGLSEQLASLALSDAPKANTEPKDFIAREQIELTEFVQIQRQQKQQRFDRQQQLQAENPSLAPAPFYLGDNQEIVAASLSPAGNKIIVAITEPQAWRADGDIMPNYIAEDGRVKAEPVRARVQDAKPVNHQLLVLDLSTGEKTALTYNTLPGWNEDVLAAVKRENYAAQGKTYKSESKPRPITLMQDWGWQQGAIRWSDDGQDVAVMLEAWDNKDRWIATVNFAGKALVPQHRLHDDAWINYTYNEFGFLPDSKTLWFMSEESGYSHLYVKPLTGKQRALTQGKFVVDTPQVSERGDFIYFKANRKHPGNFEVFRVPTAGGAMEQLTELGGFNDFQLNRQEDKLLITHSTALQPPELYVAPVTGERSAQRLTNTITPEFNAKPWTAPSIVAIDSSHVDDPIYTRVYLPDDFDPTRAEKYPAVVFIHGAGYLHNAHMGWSGYQREFMFHSLLNQHGYVVLDLDYRGSKGYGRDWRTAIYRQMGTPEVEDLVDVVKWAGQNVHVDTDRVGTYGGSYGGFLTFMALFKEPGLFQAGAALRPVSDWAHYNIPYTSNILNLPEDDPIAYRRSSPIYFTEGLEDALLINSPMVDDNVFFQDSVRVVQRLIEHEKEDFEIALFPVEPHGFVQPSSWLDEYRRIFKLFEEELK